MESALKLFQKTYHLNATGKLDSGTVNLINTPRYGVPDNLGKLNYPNEITIHNGLDRHGIHIGSHYAFFEGNLKWPPQSVLSRTNTSLELQVNSNLML